MDDGELLGMWVEAFTAFEKASAATGSSTLPGGGFDRCARIYDDCEKIIAELRTRAARNRRVYCCSCGKQVVSGYTPARDDIRVTKLKGSKAGFKPDEVFCGYCAEDLDENGMFPEERAQARLVLGLPQLS